MNFDQDHDQERGRTMHTVSISEARHRIQDLVEQVNEKDEIYYITRYNQVRAVILGVEQYETLLRRLEQLEESLTQVWIALEGSGIEGPIMLPTPDGHWRPFHPSRPLSSEAAERIQAAASLAWQRRGWPVAMTVERGRHALERARKAALAQGIAIRDERQAATDD